MSWEKSELNVMSCLFVLGYEISTYKDKHLWEGIKMGKKIGGMILMWIFL
jgi:hypothetical protein